jgi:glycosyltransferase involved in cell wall biosynthesis
MQTIAHVRLRFLPLTETFIYREVKGIKKYRTLVLCAERQNADKFPYNDVVCTRDDGLLGHLLNGAYLKFGLGSPYFSKVIEKEGVRLLHAHYGPTGTRMLPLKRKHKIPLVTSFRGIDASLFPARNPRMYEKLFAEGDIFLVRSRDMADDLSRLGCPEAKIQVLHSGINPDEFQFNKRLPSKDPVLLTVARLSANKGIQHTISAFFESLKRHPHARLRIVGEGPFRQELERQIKRLGLADKVTLLGAMSHDEVVKEMDAAHIFVLSSYTTDEGEKEGVPNVLMESAACGMPVISSRHAGIPELVLDGKSGILVPERDEEALALAMGNLLDKPDSWGRFGAAGRAHVQDEFNIITQAKRAEDVYSRLIGD